MLKYKDKVKVSDDFYGNPTGVVISQHKIYGLDVFEYKVEFQIGAEVISKTYENYKLEKINNE